MEEQTSTKNPMVPLKGSKRLSILTILMSGLVFGIILYILYKQRFDILAFPWRFHWKYLVLLSLFHSLALGATFVAWHLIMARLGDFHDLRKSFRFYYISALAKRLPSSLPYAGSRLLMYRKEGVSGAAIMNAILLENLLVGIGGVLVFMAFIPFYTHIPTAIVIPLAVVTFLLTLTLFIRPQLIIEAINWVLRKMHRRTLEKVPRRKDILIWIAIYTLPWIFASASFFCLPRAFSDIDVIKWSDAIAISALSTLASLLNFVLPGGLALKELTSSALLIPWIPLSAAVVLTVTYRVIHTLDEILWALVALLIPVSH
jgi:glycosyltransferase 2 family protein